MIDSLDGDEPWSLFPLHDNLTNSFVDTSKLISYMSDANETNIGMHNFRSKKTNQNINPLFARQQQQTNPISFSSNKAHLIRMRWKAAMKKVKWINDPWAEFKLDAYPTERAVRHRYNAIKKKWVQDECTVKIEPVQFACGAMRACYRLKKLSNLVHKDSWEHASNYVAKAYIDPSIPRERYFDDVKLQMDAKLWAEIYNRHNPPKKIDMFQVSILEFKDRPNSPLYHLEHFIDGKYIKYNSNSGFVEDEHIRFTPQAFSHFTFECSNHDLIVVDVQGVGDLYTDPQIHTAKGTDYGDGNLGVKGFALFFSSHICNPVCKSLGLTQFDLAPSELKCHEKLIASMQKSSHTVSRGCEEMVIGSPCSFGEYFRHRRRCRSSTSYCSDDQNSNSNDLPDIYESEGYESSTTSPLLSPNLVHQHSAPTSVGIQIPNSIRHMNGSSNPILIAQSPSMKMSSSIRRPRFRNESSCLDSAFSIDEAANYFDQIDAKIMFKPRPSNVQGQKKSLFNFDDRQNLNDEEEVDDDDDEDEGINQSCVEKDNTSKTLRKESDTIQDESVLGMIHFELCKYHEMGRFLIDPNDAFDMEAAVFHLKQAAELDVKDALITLAKIYLQIPHDILSSYSVDENDTNKSIGFDYMTKCASLNDKYALDYVAKAYDTGVGLSNGQSIDWKKSIAFYKKLLEMSDEEEAEKDFGFSEPAQTSELVEPSYSIMARIGEMYMKGGNCLEQDPNLAYTFFNDAAEKATQCGKGRLANKYYMLAEQASSMCD